MTIRVLHIVGDHIFIIYNCHRDSLAVSLADRGGVGDATHHESLACIYVIFKLLFDASGSSAKQFGLGISHEQSATLATVLQALDSAWVMSPMATLKDEVDSPLEVSSSKTVRPGDDDSLLESLQELSSKAVSFSTFITTANRLTAQSNYVTSIEWRAAPQNCAGHEYVVLYVSSSPRVPPCLAIRLDRAMVESNPMELEAKRYPSRYYRTRWSSGT
ncbi:hypothetical protein AG1IA_04257 [Rhizoctonia solani AG-1 IA]|uniref:Uncharacterized protein n=1 Tax=Thanatephorus cucumeris (strain AG1-IA) TaxID=983506 RepID=L8WZB8_THACA|nr:hypothetical protein AG1IA_04257 [Rhizoctonia solani AG-1 IA]